MRFGGAEVDEGQRQFGVAVVSIGENAVGHHEANHAITHHLLKAFGQVLRQSLCDGFDDFLSVCRQLRDIFLWGLDGFFGHGLGFLLAYVTGYKVLNLSDGLNGLIGLKYSMWFIKPPFSYAFRGLTI